MMLKQLVLVERKIFYPSHPPKALCWLPHFDGVCISKIHGEIQSNHVSMVLYWDFIQNNVAYTLP
jgi:hypothetical protein